MSELAMRRGGRASSPATRATASPSVRQSGRERFPRATGTNRNVSRKRRRNGSCTSRECSPRCAEASSASRGDAARRRSASSSSIGTSPQGRVLFARHAARVDVPCVGHDDPLGPDLFPGVAGVEADHAVQFPRRPRVELTRHGRIPVHTVLYTTGAPEEADSRLTQGAGVPIVFLLLFGEVRLLYIRTSEIPREGLDVVASRGKAWIPRLLEGMNSYPLRSCRMLSVTLFLSLEGRDLETSGSFAAEAEGECDRCTEPVALRLEREFQTIYVPADLTPAEAGDQELQAGDLDIAFFNGAGVGVGDIFLGEGALFLSAQ